MKKQLGTFLNDKKFHYLLIFLFSCILAIPLIPLQVISTHDGVLHILRLIGTDLSFHYTNFPHLIIPFFCDNFGYSINAFYSPIATYLPYLFTSLPILYSEALKIFSYFTILLSGFTMYHCAFEITKKRPIALIASLFFMMAPYRLEDMYVRFALAEFTTFIFIPIVFQGMYNLLQGDQKKHFYLTIGATGLILTHTITTLYVALFCLLYLLFYWKRIMQKEVWKKILWNLIFILGLSAFYWIILLEYQNFANYVIFDQELMRTNGEFVASNAIPVTEFFWKDKADISCKIGIFTAQILLSSVFFIKKIREEKTIFIYLFLSLLCLYLCTNLFLWKLMPNLLCQIQYPWRMLGEFIFFSSIVVAINVNWIWEELKEKKLFKILFVVLAVGMIIGALSFQLMGYCKQKEEETDDSYERAILSYLNFTIYHINRDYLPCKTMLHKDEIDEKEDKPFVLEGDVMITNQKKEATNLSFQIENGKEGTKIEIPYFYYPGYAVILQTEKGEVKLKQEESEYGLICVRLPEEVKKGEIRVSYQGTRLEKIAYLISLLAYFVFLQQVVSQSRKKEEKKDREKS